MDTALEALLRAMFNDDWFTKTSGDDDFGFSFGYTTILACETKEIHDAFSDTIDTYGDPGCYLVGSYYVRINSDGVLEYYKFPPSSNQPERTFGIVECGYQEHLEEKQAHEMNEAYDDFDAPYDETRNAFSGDNR